MSTDLTPERKLCDWIDANGIVMQGATPSMLLSAAGLDALTARAEAAERDRAAVTVSRDGWQTRAEAAEKAVARIERLSHAVRKLAGWSGNDIADLIEDGLIKEGDLS